VRDPTRNDYFEQLKQELNPTIWVTEWMSYRLMDVEFSLDQSAEAVIRLCLEGTREFLSARSFGGDLVEKIVNTAPYTTETKLSFNRAFKDDLIDFQDGDLESGVKLALYCFLHVAFTYKV
jgi:hypothetical protein